MKLLWLFWGKRGGWQLRLASLPSFMPSPCQGLSPRHWGDLLAPLASVAPATSAEDKQIELLLLSREVLPLHHLCLPPGAAAAAMWVI